MHNSQLNQTQLDSKSIRRYAAWRCFSPYLDDKQCLEIMYMLDREFQLDSVIAMTGFIVRVCNQFQIAATVRKTLQLKFYQLVMQPPVNAFDPLIRLHQAPITVMQPEAEPVTFVEEAAAVPVEISRPAHVVLFELLVKTVMQHCGQEHEMVREVRETVRKQGQTQAAFAHIGMNWFSQEEKLAWVQHLNLAELKQFVHWLYTALCEQIGPVDADRCFHKALAIVDEHPDAKLFPVQQFL